MIQDNYMQSLEDHQGAYRNGLPLRRHVESAHEGEFKEDCRACVEILAKQEEWNEKG